MDVAIVGGGASGVLVAMQLLEALPGQVRIAIIEPHAALALGAAYATTAPEHLLNVPAGRMSAFPDRPGDFVDFLVEDAGDAGDAADADEAARPVDRVAIAAQFAPRRTYARYLQARLAALATPASLQWLRTTAIDIDDIATSPRIALQDGSALHASQVVLAVGNTPRALPVAPELITGTPRIDSAWDYAALRAVDADADVGIIGAGLSMVDVVVGLAARGHRGRIDVFSRHGLLPLAHAGPGPHDGDIDDLVGLDLRALTRALRKRALNGAANGEPWQWTMDRLRPFGQALWRGMRSDDRRRFLRLLVRQWDIHRHRLAPAVAAQVDALRASGQLAVHAGHVMGLHADASATNIDWRPRGSQLQGHVRVQRIFNATGVEARLAHLHSPLLETLHARGDIAPGPLGIGLCTDDDGVLLDADGRPQPRMRTLAAMRIGQLWESIAIPDLRGQAKAIALAVAADLQHAPAVQDAPVA